MGFTAGTINYTLSDTARGMKVTANSSASLVQCYVNGSLIASRVPEGNGVFFRIDSLIAGEYIRLLAVDEGDGTTNFFSEAFPDDAGLLPR